MKLKDRLFPRSLRRIFSFRSGRRQATAVDGNDRFVLGCRSDMEAMRIRTFAEKEKGTNAWIRESVRPGQVFIDVGANIGVYTLLAAKYVGGAGRVYAFEPHVVNCASLLANVAANGFSDRVQVFSCAVNDEDGFLPFRYSSLVAGVAFNQLLAEGDPAPLPGKGGQPAVEMKQAVSIDRLIADGVLPAPHHVKIDVDGIEPRILQGMRTLLGGRHAPLSVQVEVAAESKADIYQQMHWHGYTSATRHDTAAGKEAIRRGAAPESIAHNVIFRRPEH